MNLYYDSEFTGLHQASSLISLAFVADDGQAFYAEFSDYERSQCDDWIQQNVLSHTRWLMSEDAASKCWQEDALTCCLGPREYNQQRLTEWLGRYSQIEVWADCLAWDWVLFCQLYGGALHIPRQIFYMPFDLVTLFKAKGYDANTPRAEFSGLACDGSAHDQVHNALHDARMIRACYQRLMGVGGS